MWVVAGNTLVLRSLSHAVNSPPAMEPIPRSRDPTSSNNSSRSSSTVLRLTMASSLEHSGNSNSSSSRFRSSSISLNRRLRRPISHHSGTSRSSSSSSHRTRLHRTNSSNSNSHPITHSKMVARPMLNPHTILIRSPSCPTRRIRLICSSSNNSSSSSIREPTLARIATGAPVPASSPCARRLQSARSLHQSTLRSQPPSVIREAANCAEI
uniref:MIP03055p n=1 Tax=Drosophila melanogaster TaxID=7227 RepID=C3KGQ9_DROME|nr:MIP03055p [Drosophila melanogaster]